MTDKPPDEWLKARRRVQRQRSPGVLRALVRRPVTAVVIAALVVLGAAAGITEGLRSGGTRPSLCQKAFVPAYFDQSTWSQATASRPAPSAMILNPSTGIGAGTAPDPAYQSVVKQAQAEGTAILGYSSTASGLRPIAQIEADVRNYKNWYGVTGIFLDSVNGVTRELPYYEQLASYIRRVIPGSAVWLNPGIYPDQRYMSVGNVVMVFEGTYAQYLNDQVPSWAHAFPATRFANTIYGAASSSEADSVISLSRSRNAGYVYVTNLAGSDPYNALPSYWSSENTAITTGCGHGDAGGSAVTLPGPPVPRQDRAPRPSASALSHVPRIRTVIRWARQAANGAGPSWHSPLSGRGILIHLYEDIAVSLPHSGLVDVRRLLLVDDYRMVTEALASRLSAAPDLWVAGCCTTDDPQLPEVVRWLRPDVILIEVEPLGFAVGEVLQRLRAAWPAAHVVVVSGDHDVAHAVEAARAGAGAWVSKEQGADELETVLRGVCQGHSWFPPQMLGEILRELRDDVRKAREDSDPLDVLSPRERDVLASMAEGKRGRQIAEELLISNDTVRTHTRSIFSKLDVHSRLEAVRVARAAGLRPPGRPGITGSRSSTTVPFRPGTGGR